MEKVRERLLRVATALEAAAVPYAVAGGNAVAAWVASVDETAVRNTRDVDLLLRRTDLPAATACLEAAGFVHRHVAGVDMFLDGPGASAREAVHIVFAGERVRPDYLAAAPTLDETETGWEVRVVSLQALVRMKLTSYRLKDQVHLQDLVELGLVDRSWLERFEPPLADRLRSVLDHPDA